MEKNKRNYGLLAIIGAVIGAFVGCILAFVVIIAIAKGFRNKINNPSNNSSDANISNYAGTDIEDYEKEHVIKEINLKYIPPKDMLILTKSEINQYMGEGYSDLYEIISMNETGKKLIYVFKIGNEEVSNYTAGEYLSKSLENSEHSEVTTETLGGLEFAKVEMEKEDTEAGEKYVENCYVYKYDNEFICIDYWRLYTDENEIATMFQKVE